MEVRVFGVERENAALVRELQFGVYGCQVVGRVVLADRRGSEQHVHIARQLARVAERTDCGLHHDVDHVLRFGQHPSMFETGEDVRVLVGLVGVEVGKYRVIVVPNRIGYAVPNTQGCHSRYGIFGQ